MVMDTKAEQERKRKIALADQAASDAFRKVEPLIVQTGANASSAGNAASSSGVVSITSSGSASSPKSADIV